MILSLKHVYYKRQGKIILEDINWEFQPGERSGNFGSQRCWQVNTPAYSNGRILENLW